MLKTDVNNVKLTFEHITHRRPSVNDRIVNYQEWTDNRRGGCVKSSGRCDAHNSVLYREVVKKRMSTVDKTGKLVWTIGEVTILQCPMAVTLAKSTVDLTAAKQVEIKSTANKKMRKYFDSSNNKSETQ